MSTGWWEFGERLFGLTITLHELGSRDPEFRDCVFPNTKQGQQQERKEVLKGEQQDQKP